MKPPKPKDKDVWRFACKGADALRAEMDRRFPPLHEGLRKGEEVASCRRKESKQR
jgi:hypothetical protein